MSIACCRTAWEAMPGLPSSCAARPAATMLPRRCHPCDLGRAPRALSTHCRHDTLAASALSEIQWILNQERMQTCRTEPAPESFERVALHFNRMHQQETHPGPGAQMQVYTLQLCRVQLLFGLLETMCGDTVACKLAFLAPCAATT